MLSNVCFLEDPSKKSIPSPDAMSDCCQAALRPATELGSLQGLADSWDSVTPVGVTAVPTCCWQPGAERLSGDAAVAAVAGIHRAGSPLTGPLCWHRGDRTAIGYSRNAVVVVVSQP